MKKQNQAHLSQTPILKYFTNCNICITAHRFIIQLLSRNWLYWRPRLGWKKEGYACASFDSGQRTAHCGGGYWGLWLKSLENGSRKKVKGDKWYIHHKIESDHKLREWTRPNRSIGARCGSSNICMTDLSTNRPTGGWTPGFRNALTHLGWKWTSLLLPLPFNYQVLRNAGKRAASSAFSGVILNVSDSPVT